MARSWTSRRRQDDCVPKRLGVTQWFYGISLPKFHPKLEADSLRWVCWAAFLFKSPMQPSSLRPPAIDREKVARLRSLLCVRKDIDTSEMSCR